jgi:hypothetical protein
MLIKTYCPVFGQDIEFEFSEVLCPELKTAYYEAIIKDLMSGKNPTAKTREEVIEIIKQNEPHFPLSKTPR